MESSRLPIELCEAIMDALPDYELLHYSHPPRSPEALWQQDLSACALTCRAWRTRAQHLLWIVPHLRTKRALAQFASAIYTHSTFATTAISLGAPRGHPDKLDLHLAGELFMNHFPLLQHLLCFHLYVDCGPPLRMLRMRLPFFDSITALQLCWCTFTSLRSLLDVVWACPNLSSFRLRGGTIYSRNRRSLAESEHMRLSAICENLRACRKLKSIDLDGNTLQDVWGPEDLDLAVGASVFGNAVTELVFRIRDKGEELFIHFLKNRFPALRTVRVVADCTEVPPLHIRMRYRSLLHAIAAGRTGSNTLKTIILEGRHYLSNNLCCHMIVGSRDDEVDSEQQPLRELLSGLEELSIRLDGPYSSIGSCATYIRSILPDMHHVLRVERRRFDFSHIDRGWRPCTPTPVA